MWKGKAAFSRLELNTGRGDGVPAETGQALIKDLVLYDIGEEGAPAPEWIWGMLALEKLEFRTCRFTEISSGISALHNLTSLSFGASLAYVERFPDISRLEKLEELDAGGDSVQGWRRPIYGLLGQILECIQGMGNLTSLRISGWKPKRKSEWLV